MAGDFLLSALQAEFGDETSLAQQPLTIRNVISQVKMWLGGEAMSHLPHFLGQMKDKVHQAALATQQDLQNPLAEDLHKLIQASLQDYVDMEDFLGELARGIQADDRALVQGELAQLSAVANSLGANQQAIQSWQDTPVLRCPRCGTQARGKDWTCADCQLEMLYQDPKGPGATRTLNLGEEFKTVFDTYVAIIKAEKSLSRLAPTLPPLRRMLENYALLAQTQQTQDEALDRALDVVAAAAMQGLEGIARLEGVPSSRQTRDLHEGWRLIFEAAAALQGQIPTLARAAGQDISDVTMQSQQEDAVFLHGDDD